MCPSTTLNQTFSKGLIRPYCISVPTSLCLFSTMQPKAGVPLSHLRKMLTEPLLEKKSFFKNALFFFMSLL